MKINQHSLKTEILFEDDDTQELRDYVENKIKAIKSYMKNGY